MTATNNGDYLRPLILSRSRSIIFRSSYSRKSGQSHSPYIVFYNGSIGAVKDSLRALPLRPALAFSGEIAYNDRRNVVCRNFFERYRGEHMVIYVNIQQIGRRRPSVQAAPMELSGGHAFGAHCAVRRGVREAAASPRIRKRRGRPLAGADRGSGRRGQDCLRIRPKRRAGR